MKVVIDTNVLMAGLLKESLVREILINEDIDFFLPEFSLSEIRKYKQELMKKSGYGKEEFEAMISYLLENIEIVPKEEIKACMKKAEEIMKDIDIKDASFIALCFAVNADGIWSFDRHFLQQKSVKVFGTKELQNWLF